MSDTNTNTNTNTNFSSTRSDYEILLEELNLCGKKWKQRLSYHIKIMTAPISTIAIFVLLLCMKLSGLFKKPITKLPRKIIIKFSTKIIKILLTFRAKLIMVVIAIVIVIVMIIVKNYK